MRPLTAGSSPLTRGKPDGVEVGAVTARLIPAHAGKTRGQLPGRGPSVVWMGLIPAHAGKTRGKTKAGVRTGAHPRSRGENLAGTETGA